MLDRHIGSAPDSRYTRTEEVRLATLDSVGLPFIADSRASFLKIDAQGFEARILKGARSLIQRIHGVQLELSLTPLYVGAPTFQEMFAELVALGFEAHALLPGFSDSHSGRMLQVDGVFFRPGQSPETRQETR
jgi:hypothetical protein